MLHKVKLEDLIMILDYLVIEEDCDKIVNWFVENKDLQKKGSVFLTRSKECDVDIDFKVAIQSNPPPNHEISHLISRIISRAYNEYMNVLPTPPTNETCVLDYTVRVYKKNEGYFKEHVDQHPATVSRIFAVICYLNDVAEGGETEFPEFDLKVAPKKGRVLIFPCNYLYKHKGNMPISNDKYTATAFINFFLT